MHYNKNLRNLARKLRKNSTIGEIILWRHVLKARKMLGYQFNRQYPIGKYIVDFICRKKRIVIEVDGSSHNYKVEKDREKEEYLKQIGYKVIRIREKDILQDIESVRLYIEDEIKKMD